MACRGTTIASCRFVQAVWAAPLRCSFSTLELDAVAAEHKAAREAIYAAIKSTRVTKRCVYVLTPIE